MHRKKNEEILNAQQLCDMFSVSRQTLKNWVRLGKLVTEDGGKTFNREYAEKFFLKVKNGEESRLRSRRNKKGIDGRALYKDYIKNENNIRIAEKILTDYEHISETELRIVLAYFAVELFCDSRGKKGVGKECLYENEDVSDNSVFNRLIHDLLKDIDLKNIDFSYIEPIFEYKPRYKPNEDTLGFIYISLKGLAKRKKTGTYYTPRKTVFELINRLFECTELECKTICDPCCGTGNFFIGLMDKGIRAENLYGRDIDEISVLITKINIFLRDNNLSKEELDSHFVCGNALEEQNLKPFSVIIGNPPWGYDYSKSEKEYFGKNYEVSEKNNAESYDLFIEKGLNMLEKDGFMAYVVPEALFGVRTHSPARKLLVKNSSFKFVSYLGNSFSGVNCPVVIFGVKKDGKSSVNKCKVTAKDKIFIINKERKEENAEFSFNMTDEEYECLEAIESVQNARYLKNNAEFAMGIVTGNNKEYIGRKKSEKSELILKGGDILRYGTKRTDNYIEFLPEKFQQSAPEKIYRAKEKLLYRFICSMPVFCYDDKQTLTLNSCNIIVPHIEEMYIKYILAVLNSSVAAYFINQKII